MEIPQAEGYYDNYERALANPDKVLELNIYNKAWKVLPQEITQFRHLKKLALLNTQLETLPE